MKSNFDMKSDKRISIALFLASLVLSVLSSLLTPKLILVSLIPIAVSSGLMAAFLYREKSSDRIYKFLLPTLVVVLDWLINGFTSLLGIIAVVVAFSIFLVYEQKWSKCESAFAITILISLFIVITCVIIGKQNDLGLGVREFYDHECNKLKEFYISSFDEFSKKFAEEDLQLLTKEEIIYFVDYAVGMLVSMIFVLGFLAAGISMKVFSKVIKLTEKEKVLSWRFKPSSVYAYFYAAISLLSFFIDGSLSIFNLTVSNLNTIFMIVYAYVGWSILSKLISLRKGNSSLSKLLIVLLIVFIPSFAIQILSYIGAFYSIVINKMGNMPTSGDKLD